MTKKKALRRPTPRPETIEHISDLTPDPMNARKHGPRNVGTIVSALQEVGAARSIVIDEDGVILAGNATVEAAGEAGITKLRVVDVDGETIVAVRRRGLTSEQKVRLALFDNRAAELAEGWNPEVLEALASQGVSLDGLWSQKELALLLNPAAANGLTDPDDVPPERPTSIQRGDLFEMGSHRLLCGDCTVAGDVARVLGNERPGLMNTDPPYGVSYAAVVGSRTNQKAGGWDAITNDELDDDSLERMISSAFALCDSIKTLFCWHPSNRVEVFLRAIRAAGFRPAQEIVWVKNALVFGRADYQWRHEPCIYAKRDGATRVDDRTQTTVWEIPKITGALHPTQKPADLFVRAFVNHTLSGESVYEPFAGSGSQFIAAEQTGRRCLGIEIEAKYCQVVVDRWEAFTGKTAQKVGEAVAV